MMITSNWFARLITFSCREFRLSPILGAHRRTGCCQRCGCEVHAETLAPYGHSTVLRQVSVRGNVVILITDIALECAQLQEAPLLHGLAVARVLCSDEVDMHIRAV